MNPFKNIRFIIFFLFLYSCADYKNNKNAQIKEKKYYSSSGFALIYEDELYKEKIINKKLSKVEIGAMHNKLKRNTPVRIFNPDNSKFVETKIFKNANYPNIFNVIITKKVAEILKLDISNPYIEIIEIKKNKTFIAKEGTIFQEEKNVFNKAPVDEIKMDDLTQDKTTKEIISKKQNSFTLLISDFYYVDSANSLKKELTKKIKINNIYVKKINDNKYRLLIGPFKNFNALKNIYISLNNLGFEDLNILRH